MALPGITVTDQSLTLTVQQALALYDPVPITVPPGDTVIVADTEAEIDSLTPAELTGLKSIGVTTVEVSNLTGAGPLSIVPGITLAISGAVPAGESITFTGLGGGGALSLSDTADMAGTIYGFSPPDTIDLTDVPIDSIDGTASLQSGNVLQILENGVTYNLQLDSAQTFVADENFALNPDAGTGSTVTVTEDPVTDYERVGEGQTVDGAVVANGGTVEVTGGGTFNRGTIDAGGTVIADYSAPAAVIGDVLIDSFGLLDLTDGAPAAATIEFGPVTDGAGGTLEINDSTMPSGTIVGMAPGDTIHLAYQFPYDSAGTAVVASGNVLQVMEDGQTFDLQLDPIQDFTPDRFALADDLNGGTNVTEEVACFLAGTCILTPHGDARVEDLRAGALVVTREGAAPVRWIGRRRIDTAAHRQAAACRPIRIRRGCCGTGKAVSRSAGLTGPRGSVGRRADPGQAAGERHDHRAGRQHPPRGLLPCGARPPCDPAGGGAGSRKLPRHRQPDDVRKRRWGDDATSGPVGGDRSGGTGASTPVRRSPRPPPRSGPIWQRIARRAVTLGFAPPLPMPTTTEPDLHLLVVGRAMRASMVADGHYAFVLPHGARTVVLRSRAAAPAQFEPFHEDRRRLGVAVRRIGRALARRRGVAGNRRGWAGPRKRLVGARMRDGRIVAVDRWRGGTIPAAGCHHAGGRAERHASLWTCAVCGVLRGCRVIRPVTLLASWGVSWRWTGGNAAIPLASGT